MKDSHVMHHHRTKIRNRKKEICISKPFHKIDHFVEYRDHKEFAKLDKVSAKHHITIDWIEINSDLAINLPKFPLNVPLAIRFNDDSPKAKSSSAKPHHIVDDAEEIKSVVKPLIEIGPNECI